LSQDKAQRPPTLSEVLPDLAARYVPISRWLPGYPKAWFRPDLTAAVTSWGVMVPVALALLPLSHDSTAAGGSGLLGPPAAR
jgi:MFS superfamily sulfate permease-like transporter